MIIHAASPESMAASRRDGASAPIDTTDATSKSARTREQRRIGRTRFCSIPLPGISPPLAKVSARQPGPSGLIFGLIRLRSPAFIGVRINVLAGIADVNGIWRTIIQTPENRKVVGSIPHSGVEL